jgi:hypothetical protein
MRLRAERCALAFALRQSTDGDKPIAQVKQNRRRDAGTVEGSIGSLLGASLAAESIMAPGRITNLLEEGA